MTETELILEGAGKDSFFPPCSARECRQFLIPIPLGAFRRTLNGTLVWVGSEQYRKFQSTIYGQDNAPPAFEGLWIGMKLRVGCLQNLTQAVPSGTATLQLEREPVTCHLYEASGKTWALEKPNEKAVLIPFGFPGGFLTYRPWLIMIVKNYQLETNEWGLSVGWRLELEEV